MPDTMTLASLGNIFGDLMKDNPAKNWGKPSYPAVE